MDIKKGKKNIIVSIGFKIITMVLVIVVKKVLIETCGNEVNGLNALYLSIIGFLSVAELGVGSAITFCMYRPIVEGDNDKVAALYQLFRKLYLVIGAIIFTAGLIVLPFVKYFAKDYQEVKVNMYLSFFLMLVSVTCTYLFASKTSLINAYKNNYISTAITQGGVVIQYILQIIVLLLSKSFVWYLVCRIIAVAIQWIMSEVATRKNYGSIIYCGARKVDSKIKKEVQKSLKAMFMHKIGYVLVNTVDSMVISIFVGVIALGEYSNYVMILSSMTSIITLMFSSLTSVIGHLYVEEEKAIAQRYYESFHLLNFVVGCVFYLGYYGIVDNLISLLFSAELVVARNISFVITLNGFVQFMRRSTLTFRDATGTFYSDRWKPLIEGIFNIVLSILLVEIVGVTGVIIATIITNLFICHVVEPYVLYKNAFNISPQKHYFVNYNMIVVFVVALLGLDVCMLEITNPYLELLVNGLISVGISIFAFAIVFVFNKKTAKNIQLLFGKG